MLVLQEYFLFTLRYYIRPAGLFQCRHQTVKLFCNSRIILNLFTTKYFRCKVSRTPVTFVFLQRCWKIFESDQSYSGLPKAFQSGWLSPITYEWEKDLKTCCRQKSITPSFIIFLAHLKKIFRIEEYLAKEKKKLNLHLMKWEKLLQSLSWNNFTLGSLVLIFLFIYLFIYWPYTILFTLYCCNFFF